MHEILIHHNRASLEQLRMEMDLMLKCQNSPSMRGIEIRSERTLQNDGELRKFDEFLCEVFLREVGEFGEF